MEPTPPKPATAEAGSAQRTAATTPVVAPMPPACLMLDGAIAPRPRPSVVFRTRPPMSTPTAAAIGQHLGAWRGAFEVWLDALEAERRRCGPRVSVTVPVHLFLTRVLEATDPAALVETTKVECCSPHPLRTAAACCVLDQQLLGLLGRHAALARLAFHQLVLACYRSPPMPAGAEDTWEAQGCGTSGDAQPTTLAEAYVRPTYAEAVHLLKRELVVVRKQQTAAVAAVDRRERIVGKVVTRLQMQSLRRTFRAWAMTSKQGASLRHRYRAIFAAMTQHHAAADAIRVWRMRARRAIVAHKQERKPLTQRQALASGMAALKGQRDIKRVMLEQLGRASADLTQAHREADAAVAAAQERQRRIGEAFVAAMDAVAPTPACDPLWSAGAWAADLDRRGVLTAAEIVQHLTQGSPPTKGLHVARVFSKGRHHILPLRIMLGALLARHFDAPHGDATRLQVSSGFHAVEVEGASELDDDSPPRQPSGFMSPSSEEAPSPPAPAVVPGIVVAPPVALSNVASVSPERDTGAAATAALTAAVKQLLPELTDAVESKRMAEAVLRLLGELSARRGLPTVLQPGFARHLFRRSHTWGEYVLALLRMTQFGRCANAFVVAPWYARPAGPHQQLRRVSSFSTSPGAALPPVGVLHRKWNMRIADAVRDVADRVTLEYDTALRDAVTESFRGGELAVEAELVFNSFIAVQPTRASVLPVAFLATRLREVLPAAAVPAWRPVLMAGRGTLRTARDLEDLLIAVSVATRTNGARLCRELLATLTDVDLFFDALAAPAVDDAFQECMPQVAAVFQRHLRSGEPTMPLESWVALNSGWFTPTYTADVAEDLFVKATARHQRASTQPAPAPSARAMSLDSFCTGLAMVVPFKLPNPFVPLEHKVGPFVATFLFPLAGKTKHRRMSTEEAVAKANADPMSRILRA